MATISEWLRKIANASRRADGSDIQLGQEVREAADVIDELVKALEETLAIAARNENGNYVASARSALSRARKDRG